MNWPKDSSTVNKCLRTYLYSNLVHMLKWRVFHTCMYNFSATVGISDLWKPENVTMKLKPGDMSFFSELQLPSQICRWNNIEENIESDISQKILYHFNAYKITNSYVPLIQTVLNIHRKCHRDLISILNSGKRNFLHNMGQLI